MVGKRHNRHSYTQLLSYLDRIQFYYILDLDSNREADGINFRYRFGLENGYDQRIVASYLDDCPCSVLEMMVALAFRCEEQIMSNMEYGNRTGQWFWAMIDSLGLSDMDDVHFDASFVDEVIDIFLNRNYERNGKGGLFTVHAAEYNMPRTEIWYQMNYYLNELSSNY